MLDASWQNLAASLNFDSNETWSKEHSRSSRGGLNKVAHYVLKDDIDFDEEDAALDVDGSELKSIYALNPAVYIHLCQKQEELLHVNFTSICPMKVLVTFTFTCKLGFFREPM